MKEKFKRVSAALVVGATSAAVSAQTVAAGPNMDGLTSVIDFGTVSTAVLSIAGMLAVVYVAIKGARIGLSMLRGG